MFRRASIGGGVDGFVMDGVLGAAECDALIRGCEEGGFYGVEEIYTEAQRNNDRCFVDDKRFATALFNRIHQYLPRRVIYDDAEWRLSAFDTLLRVNRYRPNQYFKAHRDTPHVMKRYMRSFYTVLFYLDTVEENDGGRTLFFSDSIAALIPSCDPKVLVVDAKNVVASVTPCTGRVAVFNHASLHAGEELRSGVKHVMRTDAIYTRAM